MGLTPLATRQRTGPLIRVSVMPTLPALLPGLSPEGCGVRWLTYHPRQPRGGKKKGGDPKTPRQ